LIPNTAGFVNLKGRIKPFSPNLPDRVIKVWVNISKEVPIEARTVYSRSAAQFFDA